MSVTKQELLNAKIVDDVAIGRFWANLNTLLNGKANTSDIPTKTSDLTNDSGFITAAAVPTKTSDLTNDGDGTNNFATVNQIPTKTSEITNDSGFIDSSAIPSAVSAFTNDSGYQTASDVDTAITTALAGITGVKFEVPAGGALPATGEAGTFYFIPDPNAAAGSQNQYLEYVYVNNHWENLGPVEADLSGYVQYSDITFMTTTEIDTMMGIS